MAVTKKNVNDIFYFTYPSSDVFLKERNYFVFKAIKQVYLTGIKIGRKTLNFGGEFFLSKPFYLDVSAYYAKYNGKFSVTIYFNSEVALGDSTTVTINATTYDCYDPYKEIAPSACRENSVVIIAPPFRMLRLRDKHYLYVKTNTKSLFVVKIGNNQVWQVNGDEYTSTVTILSIPITKDNFISELKDKTTGSVVSKIERIADLLDESREWVQVQWRTRWGLDVSHIFYLDTYATDKDDAQEVESEYLHEEHSKHVIKGSFYLDNIKEPYDLWYYQTLAQSELVTFKYWKCIDSEGRYIPNGTNDFNGVKITGCNIKDAVVDGVAQSTITFDFEMR